MKTNRQTGPQHILVIDDDTTNNLIFGKHLEIIDKQIVYISTTTVSEGFDYLKTCLKGDNRFPDMIFVDRHMPGKDGLYFLDLYDREYYPEHKDTKVFLVSSMDKQLVIMDLPKSYKAVTDYIEKGVLYEQLPTLTQNR